jgi:hypothetical protein
MSEVKICPILSSAKHISEYMGINNNLVLCQQEQCEWFDKQNKCCIVNALSCLVSIGR